MSRRVVGPAAVLPDGAGRLHYFYRGTYLPDGLDAEAVQRCIDRGLVAEVEVATPAVASEDDGESDDDGSDDELDDDESDDEPNPERPKLTASTEAWREFRRPTHGDAVDGMNRQQLIDLG